MSLSAVFHLTWDADGDFLYIAKSREIAAGGIEDEDGIVLQCSGADELIGATVLAFKELWSNDRSRLASRLSSRFQIPIGEARDAVDDAFEARAPSP